MMYLKKNVRSGLFGREFVTSDESMMSSKWMCQNFIDHMDTAFEKWTPRKRYSIYKIRVIMSKPVCLVTTS